MPRPPVDREAEFRRLFAEHHRHVLAYALRRTEQRADADDVMAGTFAVAWRRFADAPAEELRLAWLYAIAARVLANQRRSVRRLGALRSRLRAQPATDMPERVDLNEVVAALRGLRAEEQEILRLAAWEGLTNAELAVAVGCSENAVAIRLHRARKRLADQLEKGSTPAGHSVVGGTAGRNYVTVAVTFPKEGMFIDYVWPGANSADPLAGYRALVQNNQPNFHLLDLNGVPGFAVDQNSDDTGQNFGVVAFTVGSTEIRVFGHKHQTTLTSVATSILDRMPSSARAAPRTESADSISLEDIPIALHAPVTPPDTTAVHPSEAAPLATTDCPTEAHTSNPVCEVTVEFPSQGLTVRYSRPVPPDPGASYRELAQGDPAAKLVSLHGAPALFVVGPTSSIEFVAGQTEVTVRGNYDEVTLRAIAQSIAGRSQSQ